MSRTPPPSLRSLEARIRNLARAQELPEGRVRRLIGIVVVGQLLARTEAAAVKGASNVEIRVGTRRARVSSDLDAVCRQSLDAFRDQLAEALRDGWDAFTGLLVDDGEIPAPVPEGYRPHRFRAKLQFRGGDFGTILIEVAPTEIGADRKVDPVAVSDAEAWFAELGLSVPGPVPTLPLDHQTSSCRCCRARRTRSQTVRCSSGGTRSFSGRRRAVRWLQRHPGAVLEVQHGWLLSEHGI